MICDPLIPTVYVRRVSLHRPGESVDDFFARISAEAGLPPTCSDPAILGRIARELVEMRCSDQPLNVDGVDGAVPATAAFIGRADDDPEQ